MEKDKLPINGSLRNRLDETNIRKVEIEVPYLESGNAILTSWEDNYRLKTSFSFGEFSLRGNREGLITLARHLLTLALNDVGLGAHIHYADYLDSLEEGDVPFVIAKLTDPEPEE